MLLLDYWKVCPKYPTYEVSYSQRVRTIATKHEKRFYYKEWYRFININYLNEKYHAGIHQMVGWTYVPNPENKPELHHIDTIKINNHPENLMWLTKQEHIAVLDHCGEFTDMVSLLSVGSS